MMTDTPKKIRKDIVDNTTGEITMAGVLNSAIPHVRQLDISTGYFNVGGYGLLRKTLEPAAAECLGMRLLMGKNAVLPEDDDFERQAAEHRSRGGLDDTLSVRSDLDEDDLTAESRDSAAGLMGLLGRPNVQVRLGTSRFNHSKCYILGDESVFIGSSNLTRGGLVGNHELNAGLYQPAAIAQAREWFERMWQEGTDAKDELMSVLQQSKFGVPPEPFAVYMKMLFERFRPLFDGVDPGVKYDDTLTKFQKDAVSTALFITSEYGGAMIADATGLGKTNMGIEIVRQKVLREGKKVLLVAPAQVLNSMWDEKLKDADINVREKLTMESLGRESVLDRLEKYHGIDFVLIDESQNFRTKTANRRGNLMKLMSVGKKKEVVLLSATPINNSLMDLYYQLSIITGGDDSHFYRGIGIPNLYEHMRKAAGRDNLQQGLEKIQQLLDSVMVRRTRSYIKDVYRDDTINGEEIRFPKHDYSPIHYSLSDMFGNIFEKVLEGIKSLTMAPYSIEQYNTALPDEEKNKHRVLGHLQVILLLKRFESSTAAAKASLENKIALYDHVRRMLDEGKMMRVRDFNSILAKWRVVEEGDDLDSDADEDEKAKFFMAEIEKTEKSDIGGDYDLERLKGDVDSDLQTLRSLLSDVKKITIDAKLDNVEKRILTEQALDKEGRKTLIFTEYTTTARYITRDLKKKFPDKVVECITGSTRQDTRKSYIRRFAPEANPDGGGKPDREIDILVSTEVLSEGQNLQDCNYVINYDLPWNPMRIVQRTGRIDRLTSRHEEIHTRACYPDRELDAILKLMGNIIEKIYTVNEVIGLDAELLGEAASPKQFNGTIAERVRALAGHGPADQIIKEIERESDVMPAMSPINELGRYIRERGIDFMRGIPMGRRSGKRGEGQSAVLAYLQERPERRVYFVMYDFKSDAARVPEDDFEAIQAASCASGEPVYLPMDGPDNQESFEALLRIDAKARKAILEKNDQVAQHVMTLRRDTRSKYEKSVEDIKSAIVKEVISGNLAKLDGEAIMGVIKSEYVRPWEDRMHSMLSQYGRSGDVQSLVSGLKSLGKSIGLAKKPAEEEPPEDVGDPSLKLVGAMFVMGDEPTPKAKGLDRHA